jgi:quercetin dioxygenase-like cupin family protein
VAFQVHRHFFETREQVLDDIRADGYWPTTLVSKPSPALDLHWHDSEVHGYVIDGRTWVLDGDTGARVDIAPGDKLVLPRGALHAEGETTETMIYIVALPEPRPFEEFLRMRSPEDAPRT